MTPLKAGELAEWLGFEVVEQPPLLYGEMRFRLASGKWIGRPALKNEQRVYDTLRGWVMTASRTVQVDPLPTVLEIVASALGWRREWITDHPDLDWVLGRVRDLMETERWAEQARAGVRR